MTDAWLWYDDRANLVILLRHLVDRGDDAHSLAYAVEKPWKFADEFETASAIHKHELSHPDHLCRPDFRLDGGILWYCDPGSLNVVCGWVHRPAGDESAAG